ncbi:MAG: hypothetical protein CML42_05575 [Rhodobacteraceae bacterium]|jgi:hypothetical protein|nr:hypothetical protein [Paracoccaceae bacterium]|tara:strand:+ start:116 stop:361 length:246 start_codon:yes stop_codon:yes gene_type:complete
MSELEKYKKQTKILKKQNTKVYKKLHTLINNVEKNVEHTMNNKEDDVRSASPPAAGAPLPLPYRDNSINSWVNSLRANIYR